MAITGTGTELDPYIVHSYDEIKTACEYENYDSSTSTYGTNYVKLANDIDCNDYGSAWEWETIDLKNTASGSQHLAELDLDGHTIKNVYVKTGSYRMFTGAASSALYDYGVIKNGKILNVFASNSNGFAQHVSFKNISFSGNYSSLSGSAGSAVFGSCQFYECAIYLESANHGNHVIFAASPLKMINTDVELHIDNITNGSVVVFNLGSGVRQVENSRITGSLTGTSEITTANSDLIANYGLTNCVIELNISGFTPKSTLSTTRVLYNSPTSVINDAAILPWMTVGTTIAAPSGEAMRSATSLNSLGFAVVPRE